MFDSVWFVLAIIGVAFIFDFINGFHDSANSIATVVSTRRGRILRLDVGRSHEREAALEGNHEDDPSVVVLQDESVLALVEPRQDEMASLDQSDAIVAVLPEPAIEDVLHPGAGRIHERPSLDFLAASKFDGPVAALAPCLQALRPGQDPRAVLPRIDRVAQHQPGIVDAAIGIRESMAQLRLEPGSVGRQVEPNRLRPLQDRAPREVIVEKEPGADHPARPQPGNMRHDEPRRTDKVRGDAQQDFPLGKGFGDEPELPLLEVAQSSVDQLGRGRRGGARKVVALHEHDRQAAPRRVAGNPDAVDAAADDEQVDHGARL